MSFSKITDNAMATHGVIGMDDTPNLSVLEMQQKFDELATDVLRPAHDTLVDELESPSAASSIGSLDGSVQEVLTELKSKEHTHANKDTIDKFDVDSNNRLLYDGLPISTSSESFKTVSVNGTNIVASIEDTLKFVNGQNVTMEADATAKIIRINSTAGDKGEKGDPGASVDVEVLPKINGVNVVKFLNSDTREELGNITVNDGANGQNGEDGAPGEDGKIINTWKGEFTPGNYLVGDIAKDLTDKKVKMCMVDGYYSTITVNDNWATLVESGDGSSLSFLGYALTNTSSRPNVSAFSETFPTIEKGKYLWSLIRSFSWRPSGITTIEDCYICTYIGSDGATGPGLTASHEKQGKVTTVTLTNEVTGVAVDSFTVTDGADGTGAGDMMASVYDSDGDGIVNAADTLKDLEASVSELNALKNIGDNVQTQLDAKLNSSDISAWAKASTKPTYTASEVGALPDSTPIPTSLSGLSDDATHRTVTDTEKATWNDKLDSSAIADMQTTTNLVTSLSESSDNTHYPSAKTVYDAIKAIPGGGGDASIDDTTIATDKVWSSSKTNTELSKKGNVWQGTSAEFEMQKYSIPNDTYISILDDAVDVGIIDDSHITSDKGWSSSHIWNLLRMRLVGTTFEIDNIASSQQSVTVEDASIVDTSIVDVYDSIFGFSVTGITVTNGKIVVTFPAQSQTHSMRIVLID